MSDYFRQIWEPVSKLSRSKQILIGSVILGILIALISVTFWSTEKKYISLFEEQLKLEDAGKITALLTQENIHYKLGRHAADIMVPIEDKPGILLKLAEKDTLPMANPGWKELFDQKSLFSGTTPEEFELNFSRGLQAQLETLFKNMKGIKDAMVILNIPKKELFESDTVPPSASIVLTLNPLLEITPDQIRTIRRLTCSSVKGLQPENVSIADTLQNDLTRLIEEDEENDIGVKQDKYAKIRKNHEKYLKEKLRQHLATMFGGSSKVSVAVNVDMDFSQEESITDEARPLEGYNSGVKISEKHEKEEYEGSDMANGGEPGVNSNLKPGAPSYPGDDSGANNKYKRTGDIINYEVTKSKIKYIKEQGLIRRITASIAINDDPERLKDIKDQIDGLAQTVIGYDKTRGDRLVLSVFPFRNESATAAIEAARNRREREKKMFKIVVGLFLAIPTLVGLVYLFIRTSRGRAVAKEEARLKEIAAKVNRQRAEEFQRKSQAQWHEWELKYENIKNFYPEITDFEKKKQKVQDLRLAAYKYAKDNDSFPLEYEEMRPEEQFTYRQAFELKKEGTLDKSIERLETVIKDRNKKKSKELNKLSDEALERDELAAKVIAMVKSKPGDTVQVIRAWLSGKAS